MERNTDRYVDEVLERFYAARQRTPDAQLYVEQRVDMSRWAKDCWGTSDAVIVSDEVLFVLDLTYGKGVGIMTPETRAFTIKRAMPSG